MNLTLLRNEIWMAVGEPSDLDPTTDVQYNGGPLLNHVVNEGQRAVLFWKDPRTNIPMRWPTLTGDILFTPTYYEGDLTADGTTTTVVLPATFGANDRQYDGWVLEINGEIRLIQSYTGIGRIATVNAAWTTAPVIDDEYKLYRRFIRVISTDDPWIADHIGWTTTWSEAQVQGNVLSVLSITDLTSGSLIEQAPRGETYPKNALSAGSVPAYWWQVGDKIYFDSNISQTLTYSMEYTRAPQVISAAKPIPELPEYLHWGIVLWGIQWGFNRQGESALKYSAKNDFQDFMISRVTPWDLRSERVDAHGSLRRN